MAEHPIILFDGICNLCNRAVQFVIQHDPEMIYKFASLQSEMGQVFLKKYDLSSTGFDSFFLIQENVVYSRSTAALMVARRLSGIIKFLYGFIIVPSFIRNFVYNLVAKNRYKWFGKKDTCMIPSVDLQSRFLN